MAKKTKRTLSNPWTKENVRELNAMVKEGIPSATIARKLEPKRTVGAVQQQIHKLGLSLRTAAKKAKKVGREVVKVAKAKGTGAKVAKARVTKRPARAKTKPAKSVVASQPTGGGMDGSAAYPVATAPVEAVPPIEAQL